MLCPYESSFHSGVIVHSICLDVPILAMRNNFSDDLRNIVGKNAIIYTDEICEELLRSLSNNLPTPLPSELYKNAYQKSKKIFLEKLDGVIK